MYNICICDDNINEISEIRDNITAYFEKNRYVYSLDVLKSAFMVLEAFKSGKHYDILFLDILMPDMDGLELARKIREHSKKCIIVFITFSKDYAIEGYKVNAFDYILKPVSQTDVDCVISRIISRITEVGTIAVRFNSKDTYVELETGKIKYLESKGHYVTFYFTDSDTMRIYGSLSKFAPLLTRYDFFVRCHKSFLVNLNSVKGLGNACFILKGGINIPISRQYQTDSKKKYSDFILGKMLYG